MTKTKFNQNKYVEEWKKENMSTVSAKYKKEFVLEFKNACKKLGVSQSDAIRNMMNEIIRKSKE